MRVKPVCAGAEDAIRLESITRTPFLRQQIFIIWDNKRNASDVDIGAVRNVQAAGQKAGQADEMSI